MKLEQRNSELEKKLESTSSVTGGNNSTIMNASMNSTVSSASSSKENSMLNESLSTLNNATGTVTTTTTSSSNMMADPTTLALNSMSTTSSAGIVQPPPPLSNIPNINQGGFIITAQGTIFLPPIVPPSSVSTQSNNATTTAQVQATQSALCNGTGDIMVTDQNGLGHLFNHSTPNTSATSLLKTSQTSPGLNPATKLLGCLSPSAKVPTGKLFRN